MHDMARKSIQQPHSNFCITSTFHNYLLQNKKCFCNGIGQAGDGKIKWTKKWVNGIIQNG